MTQEPNSEVIQKFKKTKNKQYLLMIPAMIGVVLLLSNRESNESLATIGIIILIISGIIGFINWRCPACKQYLGKGTNPSFCNKCGTALK